MRTAPLMIIILPTVGINRSHRTYFTLLFLFLFFAIFTGYGLYAVEWWFYRYCALVAMCVIAIIIVNYFGGYFAFWVVFPLFSALIVGTLIVSLMRQYVWTFVAQKYPQWFGLIYPIYLSVLEIITYKCMLWFRLPYSIRKFFAQICPHCCCRVEEDEDGRPMTPVYYDNFDNVWDNKDAFAIGYLSTRVLMRFTSHNESEADGNNIKRTAPRSPVVPIEPAHSPIIITPQTGNSGMLNFPRGALQMTWNDKSPTTDVDHDGHRGGVPITQQISVSQLSNQSATSVPMTTPRELVADHSDFIPEEQSDDKLYVNHPTQHSQDHDQPVDGNGTESMIGPQTTETLAPQQTISMSDVKPGTPTTPDKRGPGLQPPANLSPIDAEHLRLDTAVVNLSPAASPGSQSLKKGKSASKSRSHRYRSTEMELTVEDVWSNDILFVAAGTVIVIMESMRVAGLIALKDADPIAIAISVVSSIALETAGTVRLSICTFPTLPRL